MWHVSSRSGVATLRTAIHLLLTYLPKQVVSYTDIKQLAKRMQSSPSEVSWCVKQGQGVVSQLDQYYKFPSVLALLIWWQ